MKYIMVVPIRLIVALLWTAIGTTISFGCLVADLIWNLKITWWKDHMRFGTPKFWKFKLNSGFRRRKEWSSPFHWALKYPPIHDYNWR
jgi:hypothetical protein